MFQYLNDLVQEDIYALVPVNISDGSSLLDLSDYNGELKLINVKTGVVVRNIISFMLSYFDLPQDCTCNYRLCDDNHIVIYNTFEGELLPFLDDDFLFINSAIGDILIQDLISLKKESFRVLINMSNAYYDLKIEFANSEITIVCNDKLLLKDSPVNVNINLLYYNIDCDDLVMYFIIKGLNTEILCCRFNNDSANFRMLHVEYHLEKKEINPKSHIDSLDTVLLKKKLLGIKF